MEFMDKFVYVFTTNWELNDGPCYELTGVYDSFDKAYNKYKEMLKIDLSDSITFVYNKLFSKEEDKLLHFISERSGDRYIKYFIDKAKIE